MLLLKNHEKSSKLETLTKFKIVENKLTFNWLKKFPDSGSDVNKFYTYIFSDIFGSHSLE